MGSDGCLVGSAWVLCGCHTGGLWVRLRGSLMAFGAMVQHIALRSVGVAVAAAQASSCKRVGVCAWSTSNFRARMGPGNRTVGVTKKWCIQG